jgi:hypothetical protein
MTKRQARELVSALIALREGADDHTASMSAFAYPTLKGNGDLIKAGTRINHNGIIKRASVDLWDTEENSPSKAPSLWTNIGYVDGCRTIPGIVTASTAFMKGEKGWWENEIYVSLIDSNVWTPTEYPDGWELISDE